MNDISDTSCNGIVKAEQIHRGSANSRKQKHGSGYLKFKTNKYMQKYYGTFNRDNLHGTGIYTQIKDGANYMYEGTMYVNRYEGYAKVIYGNCTYFEGLFKNDKRFGPGVLSYAEGLQDVGFWNGMDLVRLADEIWPERVPQIAQTIDAKLGILKYRKLVSLVSEKQEEKVFCNENIRNPKSYFFDHKIYDSTFYKDLDNYIDVSIEDDEDNSISQLSEESVASNSKIPYTIRVAISKMIKNMIYHHEYTPKELFLLQLKCQILSALVCENNPNSLTQQKTKKVFVTDLLAWNNEKFCIDVLKHSFKNRHNEHTVNFNVSKLLKGDRNSFGAIGIQESACIAFLTSCSEGRLNDISKIFAEFQINPDVTDSNGNSGVIYAASRDHIKIIKVLTNLGAKLDILNDEGLTSLNICLLRYLSVFKEITNWEAAFLNHQNDSDASSDANPMNGLWNQKELLVTKMAHSYFSNISYCGGNFFQQHKDLILNHWNEISAETKSLNWFLEKLGISENDMENFQLFYEYTDDPKQTYLFNWDMVQCKKKKKKKPKAQKKINLSKLAEKQALALEIEKKLQVISNSIQVLLHLGTNPNIGNVPIPAVILALYCDNANILRMVLNANVDIDSEFGEQQLGLLHILASMPATENMRSLAEVLLNEGNINARSRTHPDHWISERKKILGDNADPPDDLGKTPLQILATRIDFDLDEEGYLNQLAQVIVKTYHNTLMDTYLGHTPLSLAVFRGNINLVKSLLEVGADPNERLQCGLGNVLTVYCLKRYKKPKMIPNVAECEYIMDILIQHWANPLSPIGEFGNALEFIEADNYVQPTTRESKSKKKKGKDKMSNKAKDKKSKKGKSKKSKKGKKKKTAQDEVRHYLLELTKSVLLRNIQGKVFIAFVNHFVQGTIQNYKHLALFLTVDDTLRIIRLLHQRKMLDLSHDVHYFICVMLLEFVKIFGYKITAKKGKTKKKGAKPKKSNKIKSKKGSKKSKNSKADKSKTKEVHVTSQDLILKILYSNEENKYTIPKKPIEFELDSNREKYKTCLNCGLRTEKRLIACPICGMVYYCSQKCNLEDKTAKSRHPCKTTFYNDELKKFSSEGNYVNHLETLFNEVRLAIPSPTQILNQNTKFRALLTALRKPEIIAPSVNPLGMLEAMGLHTENLQLDAIMSKKELEKSQGYDAKSSIASSNKKPEKVPMLHSKVTQTKRTTSQSTAIVLEDPSEPDILKTSMTYSVDNHSIEHYRDHTYPVHQSEVSDIFSQSSPPRYTSSTGKANMERHPQVKKKQSPEHISASKVHVNQVRAKSTDLKKKKNDITVHNFENIINRVRDSVFIFKHKHGYRFRPNEQIQNEIDGRITKKKDPNKNPLVNQEFINTLDKLFPNFDFTKALAPFVCYSDTQFYYKFTEHKPEYFSTHM